MEYTINRASDTIIGEYSDFRYENNTTKSWIAITNGKKPHPKAQTVIDNIGKWSCTWHYEIELATLEDLHSLIADVGKVVIEQEDGKLPQITIYDSMIE